MIPQYQVKIIDSLSPDLYGQWLALWEKSSEANFINSPHWFRSVSECFKYRSYKINTVSKDGALVSRCYFFKEKRYGMPFYTIPPTDFVYGNPFLTDITDQDSLRLLVRSFSQIGNVFLDNVTSSLLNSIRKLNNQVSFVNYCPNRYLRLDNKQDLDLFLKNRKYLLERTGQEENDFKLRSFADNPAEGLKIAFALDAKSSKNTRGYAAFSGDLTRSFYTHLAEEFGRNFTIHILYTKSNPIAYEIGFIVGDKYFWNQTAFDDIYRSISPGRVGLVMLIETLKNNHLSLFDMGTGDNRLKKSVTVSMQPLYKVVISASPVIRIITTGIYWLRNSVFVSLSGHRRLYSVYRWVRSLYSHEI